MLVNPVQSVDILPALIVPYVGEGVLVLYPLATVVPLLPEVVFVPEVIVPPATFLPRSELMLTAPELVSEIHLTAVLFILIEAVDDLLVAVLISLKEIAPLGVSAMITPSTVFLKPQRV